MTDHLQLLDDLLVQADETMALIQQDVERTIPPADHPMWASMARQKSVPMETNEQHFAVTSDHTGTSGGMSVPC